MARHPSHLLKELQEKEAFFRKEQVVAVDPDHKFLLERRLEEIQREIARAKEDVARYDELVGDEASDEMLDLSSAEDGAPNPFIVGIPIERDEDFFGFQAQRNRLHDFLEAGQSVQILGGQRRGKTSLLKWTERQAPQWQSRPVVWINAQGPAGHSPESLTLAIAKERGRRDMAEEALRTSGGDSSVAAQVFEELLPLVLLVDEASALAGPQHGFDEKFLNALRAFCQERRLVWVSASFQDIRELFRDTGLTSRFLNDARMIWVGQLEESAAQGLVGSRLDPELAAIALREAGGFAFGLQYLGDLLQWDSSNPEASCDTFADGMRNTFEGWWRNLSAEDRKLLKRCVPGMNRSQVTDRRRRRIAQRLKRQGLLTEEGEQLLLPGVAWQDFVQDSSA